MLSDGTVLVTASADAQDDLLDRRDEEMGFSLARATTYQVAALYADGLTRDPTLSEIVMDAWRELPDGEMELSDLVYGTALTLAEQDVSQAIILGMSDLDTLNEVTRSFSEYARNTCEGMPCQEEVDTLLDAPGLASELREWGGCWQDMHVEELARSAEFRASTLLAATNGCEPESAVLDSILQWQEDALPYSRPSDIGPSAIDWLCESQGTTLEEVVNDPRGAFAESMREELLESGCCGSRPCVCVMSSMSFGQWVTTTSCTAAAPEMEGCAFVADDSCLVGIYDPAVGAGGLMGVRLERPIEVPAPLVRDNMQEPQMGETWGSYYTPQNCYGFSKPFAGHAKDAPKGREAKLPGPHEGHDIHRP